MKNVFDNIKEIHERDNMRNIHFYVTGGYFIGEQYNGPDRYALEMINMFCRYNMRQLFPTFDPMMNVKLHVSWKIQNR